MVQPVARLAMRGIGKRFGGVVALEEVSFEVLAGTVHAVVGENGAGKSTLMKIISGAITDYEGELVLHGSPVRFRGPRDAEEQGVSIIYQELNLVRQLSAAANIFLGREIRTAGLFLNDRAMDAQAAEWFAKVGARFSPRTLVRDLRIGDQQLVEIAKALALEADVVIMDEPTSALAEVEVARLFEVIASLKAHGVTVLYISHKMDEVFQVADRITVLRDGQCVRTLERGATMPGEVIRLMVGREIASVAESSALTGPELLGVEGLSLPHRHRPGAWQLRDIRFSLRAGEILGVAGLLGAGRTELLECLFGASRQRPTGTIRVAGKERPIRSPRDATTLGLALVTEDRKGLGLFEALNVRGNVTISSLREWTRWGLVRLKQERRAALGQVEKLAIRCAGLSAKVSSLSGGNQQKCILGRWLLTRPRVLLLDEPTRGIDVGAKAEIYTLLRRLSRQGIGIVMTSSELTELLAVCDRIIVLCQGRLTGEFDRTGATEEAILHAAMAFGQPSDSAGESSAAL